MKQTYISQWPALSVRIPPEVLDRLSRQAEERALPVSAIVREVLRAYRPVDAP
jgi:predicted DNA-binding protein